MGRFQWKSNVATRIFNARRCKDYKIDTLLIYKCKLNQTMPNNPFYISQPGSDSDSSEIVIDDSTGTESMSVSSGYSREDDEYSIDSTDEFICEQIFRDESSHIYEDKTDKKYYIGTSFIIEENIDMMLISNSISSSSFYKYKHIDVLHYLLSYSIVRSNRVSIDIMQLNISIDGIYKVVLKTFWLRIVQRTWKRIFKERQEMLRKRMSILSLRHREVTGKYPIGIRVLPDIIGMILHL